MSNKLTYDITSLNVRGLREQSKRRSIFSYLKDQKSKLYFLQETYSEVNDETIWRNEWGGKIFFSHGTKHSKGVCILIHPSVQDKIEYSFSDKFGRIVLITIVINSLMLSLCNIYAPNNQGEQLEFLQELNNCLIDKSELTTLIVGGDWNCTLSKNDKIGGKPWKATNYRNLVLTTLDILDLVDIQRERHPKLRKYSYESKVLKVKSRIDFFWWPKT
jgi:exonuclease III